MQSGGWSDVLGDLDGAIGDSRKTLVARCVATVVAAVLLGLNLGQGVGLIWLALSLLAEACGAASSVRTAGRGRSPWQRGLYVLSATSGALIWSAFPVFFWRSGLPGGQIVALLTLAALLIDAQAFGFRSRIILAICGGVPALVLMVLVTKMGGLAGLALLTATLALLSTLGYALASAKANVQSAKALEASRLELEKIAYIDALTDLANRRMFTEDFQRLVAYSKRHATPFSLLLIDLDRFKMINDTLGHDAGDALLVEAATRLKASVREVDRVARLGGDEFAILLANEDDPNNLATICQRIIDSFAPEVEFGGARMKTTPSIGLAVFPNHGQTEETLFKAADLALYRAKDGGRNAWSAPPQSGTQDLLEALSPTAAPVNVAETAVLATRAGGRDPGSRAPVAALSGSIAQLVPQQTRALRKQPQRP